MRTVGTQTWDEIVIKFKMVSKKYFHREQIQEFNMISAAGCRGHVGCDMCTIAGKCYLEVVRKEL